MSSCQIEHDHHGGDDHHEHHHHDPNHSHDDDLTPAIQSSLYQHIDFDAIHTLNESEPDSGKAIVKKSWDARLDDEPMLRSDSDEELLMFIPYVYNHLFIIP